MSDTAAVSEGITSALARGDVEAALALCAEDIVVCFEPWMLKDRDHLGAFLQEASAALGSGGIELTVDRSGDVTYLRYAGMESETVSSGTMTLFVRDGLVRFLTTCTDRLA